VADAWDRQIQFVPNVPWPHGALVQVFLDATAVDTDGATVTSYQGPIQHGGRPGDDGATGGCSLAVNEAGTVPRNTAIHVAYSAPVNAASVTTTGNVPSVYFFGNGRARCRPR